MSDDRIAVDPDVCLGEPHIKGTERPVSLVVHLTEAGLSPDEIVAAYPELTVEDVKAALACRQSLAMLPRPRFVERLVHHDPDEPFRVSD